MSLYKVKIRREIEFEGWYECEDEGLAEDLAKLECGVQGTIVDQQVIVAEVDPAMVDN